MMLLEIQLQHKNLSNSSASSGFASEEFDCEDFNMGPYAWTGFSVLCFVFGFPATVAILWEMFKMHRRRNPFSPNDFFVLNLSTMDAIFLVFIPLGVMNHFIWQCQWFEKLWDSVYTLNMCGRPLLMTCTCLDCYVAVVHPVTYHKRKDLAPRVVMAGIVWTLTIANGIAYFCVSYLDFTMFAVVTFLIVVIIIGICDGFIIHALQKSGPGRNSIHPQKQRAIQTLIFSLVIVVIAYLPPIFLILIQRFLSSQLPILKCLINFLVSITSTWGSAVMPLLYLFNIGKLDFLRLGIWKL